MNILITICLLSIVCSQSIVCIVLPLNNKSTLASQTNETFHIERLVENKIFWSPFALSLIPNGFDDLQASSWINQLRSAQIEEVKTGCGRQPNRFVNLVASNSSFSFGSCFRYRFNYDQLQGELFSYLLGRALDMRNFPPTAIVQLKRFVISKPAATAMKSANWNVNSQAVATQFVANLTQAPFLPALSVFSNRSQLSLPTHQPVISFSLLNETLHSNRHSSAKVKDKLLELIQWSDLIVFDYLIGNLDRLVNNLSNMRWNPDMLTAPVHNLYRRSDGLLVFLDQESGLLHGYRLLPTYERMHRQILQQLCLFNPNTITRLQQLADRVQLREELMQRLNTASLADQVDFLPESSLRTLTKRISKVLQQVNRCSRWQTPA